MSKQTPAPQPPREAWGLISPRYIPDLECVLCRFSKVGACFFTKKFGVIGRHNGAGAHITGDVVVWQAGT